MNGTIRFDRDLLRACLAAVVGLVGQTVIEDVPLPVNTFNTAVRCAGRIQAVFLFRP